MDLQELRARIQTQAVGEEFMRLNKILLCLKSETEQTKILIYWLHKIY